MSLSTVVAEALKQAGYTSPPTAITTRAEGAWINILRNQLWLISRKWKSLQTSTVHTITKGLPRYALPTDFSSHLELTFVTGTKYGTALGGSTTSVTGAASETHAESDVIGKEMIITSGTGAGGRAYITGYDTSTKVYTTSPVFATAPVSGSGYLVVSFYQPLGKSSISNFQRELFPTSISTPEKFFIEGDSTVGHILLHPVPYRTDSQPMALIQRYYANLQGLDTAGTLFETLLTNWLSLWNAGIKWLALDDMDDNRAVKARQEFEFEKKMLVMREAEGVEEGSIETRVTDY
jgi:hypothetical protein